MNYWVAQIIILLIETSLINQAPCDFQQQQNTYIS